MRVAAWLAAREIAGSPGGFLLGSVVVAAVIAIAIATDALTRGTQDAVAAHMDRISAPIEVVPAGISSTQLRRGSMGTEILPPGTMDTIAAALGGKLRGMQARLVLEGPLGEDTVLVVGTSRGAAPPLDLQPGQIALGAVLSQRLRLGQGDSALLMGEKARVISVLPSAGNIDDVSAFSSLEWVQALAGAVGEINHLRLFLRAGADSNEAKALLDRSGLAANVIRRDRGDAVDREAPESLSMWRVAALTAAAIACAAWLALAARLNLAERRREMATLVAIGAGTAPVVTAVVFRSGATAAVGVLLGIATGTVVVSLLQGTAAGTGLGAFGIALLTVTISAGVVAQIAARAARADPVEALEER